MRPCSECSCKAALPQTHIYAARIHFIQDALKTMAAASPCKGTVVLWATDACGIGIWHLHKMEKHPDLTRTDSYAINEAGGNGLKALLYGMDYQCCCPDMTSLQTCGTGFVAVS